jgi:hypothetical protein
MPFTPPKLLLWYLHIASDLEIQSLNSHSEKRCELTCAGIPHGLEHSQLTGHRLSKEPVAIAKIPPSPPLPEKMPFPLIPSVPRRGRSQTAYTFVSQAAGPAIQSRRPYLMADHLEQTNLRVLVFEHSDWVYRGDVSFDVHPSFWLDIYFIFSSILRTTAALTPSRTWSYLLPAPGPSGSRWS